MECQLIAVFYKLKKSLCKPFVTGDRRGSALPPARRSFQALLPDLSMTA
jgi:hypothetical protein